MARAIRLLLFASLLSACSKPDKAAEETPVEDPKIKLSGVIVAKGSDGMTLRSEEGEVSITWNDETEVALDVPPKQLKNLRSAGDMSAMTFMEGFSPLELELRDRGDQIATGVAMAIRKFLAAEDWQARLKLVRDPERVRPLMKDYYERYPGEDRSLPIHFPDREGWDMKAERNRVRTFIGPEEAPRPMVVERTDDGVFLVDWETFVGYSEVPWERIPARESAEPFVIRAKVRSSLGLPPGFDVGPEWSHYHLVDRTGHHALHGFRKLGEGAGFMDSEPGEYSTLLVAKAQGQNKKKHYVEIREVLSKNWDYSGPGGWMPIRIARTEQRVDYTLPAGPITGIYGPTFSFGADAFLEQINRGARTIMAGTLDLRFNEEPAVQRMPTADDPRAIGLWKSAGLFSDFTVNGDDVPMGHVPFVDGTVLLFNVLTTDDCVPFLNRAVVIGRREGDRVVAQLIKLRPVPRTDELGGDSSPK